MFHNLSHLGNANLFAEMYAGTVRYCVDWDTWMIWDGTRWAADETIGVDRLCRGLVQERRRRATECEDDELREVLESWAHRCENPTAFESMKKLSRSDPLMVTRSREYDVDEWSLNCANGIIDLMWGSLDDHTPDKMMTSISPIEYDPDATCPKWEEFVSWTMKGDKDMIDFLQRALGMSLTGSMKEQVWYFMYGRGANGKSTMLKVIGNIMGQYAHSAPADLFLEQRQDNHMTAFTDLDGPRLITCIDPPEGCNISLGMIKQITGGDPVSARRMRQDYYSFVPKCKIWFAANDKPAVRSTSDGTWRRVVLIPFDNKVLACNRDFNLDDKLMKESKGILAWLVRGAMDWYQSGLRQPERVLQENDEYREDQDYVGSFISECCESDDDSSWLPLSTVYDAYRQWAADSGSKPMSKIRLGREMVNQGYKRGKKMEGRVRCVYGLKLNNPWLSRLSKEDALWKRN